MKSRWFPLLVAVVALAASPTLAHADDAAVRKTIQANYDRISAAFRESKPEVMDSLLAPDATLTTPDHHTWNRDHMVSDFKRQTMMMKNATWSRKVTALKVHGDEAVATVKGTFHGTFLQGGQSHVFDLNSMTVDTWVRSGGAWKLKHADTRDLNAKIDGKAPSAGMGGHR